MDDIDHLINFENLIFPVIPSPDDDRDWIAEARLAAADGQLTFPKTLDLRNGLPKPRNQGSRGTCVGFSGAGIKEWQERGNEKIQSSS